MDGLTAEVWVGYTTSRMCILRTRYVILSLYIPTRSPFLTLLFLPSFQLRSFCPSPHPLPSPLCSLLVSLFSFVPVVLSFFLSSHSLLSLLSHLSPRAKGFFATIASAFLHWERYMPFDGASEEPGKYAIPPETWLEWFGALLLWALMTILFLNRKQDLLDP